MRSLSYIKKKKTDFFEDGSLFRRADHNNNFAFDRRFFEMTFNLFNGSTDILLMNLTQFTRHRHIPFSAEIFNELLQCFKQAMR